MDSEHVVPTPTRKTFGKIRQNLFWAFLYKMVNVPLTAFGFLNLIIAGAAMAFSSVSVVSNALLLHGLRPAILAVDLDDVSSMHL